MSDDAFSVGTGTLGVHNTLGDTLAGEVGQLVNQVEIGQYDWAAWTSGHRVLIVIDWGSL